MTVSTTNTVMNYIGDGVVTVFSFTFKVIDGTDVVVYLDDALSGLGFFTTVNPDQETSPGGTITFNPTPPAVDQKVTLRRELPLTQQTDYTPYDPFPAETHEAALDKLTMQTQELAENVDRSVQAPASDDGSTSFVLPAYDAGKGIMWDPVLKVLKNSIDNFDTIVANASASEVAAAVSAAAALVSELAAAATYDLFDDRYLGAKSSDPTLDNDGDPLLVGAQYWNTTTNETRVWSGTAWSVVGGGSGGHTGVSDTATGVVFNLSDTMSYLTTLFGVGAAHDLGVGLHVKTSDVAGASIFSSADQAVFEANTSGGITIVSNDASTGYVVFADGASSFECGLAYAHGTDEFSITTAGFTKRFQMKLGMWMGAATGTDMGVGTGNFEGLFLDGKDVPRVLYGTYVTAALATNATQETPVTHQLGSNSALMAMSLRGATDNNVAGYQGTFAGGTSMFLGDLVNTNTAPTSETVFTGSSGAVVIRVKNFSATTQVITADYIITAIV